MLPPSGCLLFAVGREQTANSSQQTPGRNSKVAFSLNACSFWLLLFGVGRKQTANSSQQTAGRNSKVAFSLTTASLWLFAI
jgi:hypothetical protein